MEKRKSQIIFNNDLANYLIVHGFNIVEVASHHKKPRESVYFFDYSDELQQVIDQYMTMKEVRKK